MTDITAPLADRPSAPHRASNEREHLVACVELLFFAYRDFTGEPDAVLLEYGFGRAHHRVLHFVNRHPGLRVAQLLDILRITKQSLARVLKQLIGEGFVVQKAGASDRRERLLYLTAKGGRLAEKLTTLQVQRVEQALAEAGSEADAATRRFLFAMIANDDRDRVAALIRPAPGSERSPPRSTTPGRKP